MYDYFFFFFSFALLIFDSSKVCKVRIEFLHYTKIKIIDVIKLLLVMLFWIFSVGVLSIYIKFKLQLFQVEVLFRSVSG